MLQDTIIVFTTDNGGPAAGFDLNHASNWPLKGVRGRYHNTEAPQLNWLIKCAALRLKGFSMSAKP